MGRKLSHTLDVVGINGQGKRLNFLKAMDIYLEGIDYTELSNWVMAAPHSDAVSFVVSRDTAMDNYGYNGNEDWVLVPMKVDLDKLSPIGKILACSLLYFVPDETLSEVMCLGPTELEICRMNGMSQEDIDKLEKNMGYDFLHKPRVTCWFWDNLRSGESPEEYIERQLQEMRDFGVTRINIMHGYYLGDFPL